MFVGEDQFPLAEKVAELGIVGAGVRGDVVEEVLFGEAVGLVDDFGEAGDEGVVFCG